MNLTTLTSKDFASIAKLLQAKGELQAKVAQIDAQLMAFESGKPVAAVGKRTMSPAARARIAAAQRARWAKIKGKKADKPVVRKWKMSAAGRAAIAAAAKARWAKYKAEKAKK